MSPIFVHKSFTIIRVAANRFDVLNPDGSPLGVRDSLHAAIVLVDIAADQTTIYLPPVSNIGLSMRPR